MERGVCSGGTRRKPVGLEMNSKSREDEVVAQLRRERRNYFLMLFN
jgi:hypothetical protein